MNRMRATAIALACCGTPALAGPEPAVAWLTRMTDAVEHANYRGTFVYRHAGRLETVSIVHRGDRGAERERIVTLSGTPLEIVREGDVVKCVLPDNRSVKVEKDPERRAFRPRLPEDAARLGPHYELAVLGTDTVAGRACQRLDVTPRDGLRYGMRLCLDSETALPLSSELFDGASAAVVEQVVFTAIEFPRVLADSEFQLRTAVEGYAWHVKEAGRSARQVEPAGVWEATRLPPGFGMTGEQLKHAVKTGAPVHHLVFSDGLAAVSVFVEPVDAARPGIVGHARRGAMSVFGHVVGGHQVTAVGEVPEAAVEMIALGIAPRAARGQP